MLAHYSPFKVAESFSMLASLFPGGIDLGVGRASGTDRTTALALQRDRRQPPANDFPDQLAELISYCGTPEQRRAQGTPQANLVAHERPQLWLLGSSEQSSVWATDLGLSYAFADFANTRRVGLSMVACVSIQPPQNRGKPTFPRATDRRTGLPLRSIQNHLTESRPGSIAAPLLFFELLLLLTTLLLFFSHIEVAP